MQTSPPPSAERPALAFDEIVIDFQGRRLLRAGQTRPLEHKAFEVLALLTASPGEVFLRDEILDAVWGHRHVTPGVLNRVMTLLRQALGEDAQTSRYLRTLHGIGYRFDLPEPPDAKLSVASLELPLPAGDFCAYPAEPKSALGAPPDRLKRKWFALTIVLFVIVTGAVLWWQFQQRTLVPADSASTTAAVPTLIVMPLKPIGADDHEITAGLSDELISAVAKIKGLRVIARESTGIAAAQFGDISKLVPQLGITHALEGSLRQTDQQLRINLRLIDAHDGRMLWTQDYDRNVADVFALEREIASAVANSLTLEFGLPVMQATQGGNADYLRRYQKARDLLNLLGSVDATEKAESEFRALAKEQPDDARAHAGLAQALNDRAFNRPTLAEGLRAEALQEAELTIHLDPSLPQPYDVQAGAACRTDQWGRCLQLYSKAMELAPSDAPSHIKYALVLARLGYLTHAHAALQEGMIRDPLNPTWSFMDARILDTLGEYEEAQIAYERAKESNHYGLWFNAVMRHDYVSAQHIAESMDDNPNDRLHGPLLKKTYVAITRALIDPSLWPLADEASREFEAKTGLWSLMRVLDPNSDAAEMIRQLELLQHRSYSTWDLLLWTKSLGYLRRDPAFGTYLQRSGILSYWEKKGFPSQCHAGGDGAVCK